MYRIVVCWCHLAWISDDEFNCAATSDAVGWGVHISFRCSLGIQLLLIQIVCAFNCECREFMLLRFGSQLLC
uniref:Uncharacterized protein n=1 Tax=Arundo donax TaxID=35708 RepID=A0A0A9CA38_ARUDO